jgi:hypothetical protein
MTLHVLAVTCLLACACGGASNTGVDAPTDRYQTLTAPKTTAADTHPPPRDMPGAGRGSAVPRGK